MRIGPTEPVGDSLVSILALFVDRFAFSRQILSVVADSFGYEAEDGQVRCWLERGLAGDA